ncbi:amidase [Halobacteriales archaeon SW_8_68_21]|nr:MAG: amidase [Halobacteriales archaeon SW_8_68_21]
MSLADHTWPELGDALSPGSVALVPLGSTEQHGPHLPLATDHLIAEALVPGTMWVDPPEFRDYVESFTRNLAYHGVDRVVFVNAHGGNVQHLREVGRRLHEDEVAYAVEWMWDESIPELVDDLFERNGPHAGPKETAMITHIAPDLVREDRLEDARDGGLVDLDDADVTVHGARTFYDAIDNSANGAFGDPTDVTPEKSERLFEAAADRLVRLAEWIGERDRDALFPEPRVERED